MGVIKNGGIIDESMVYSFHSIFFSWNSLIDWIENRFFRDIEELHILDSDAASLEQFIYLFRVLFDHIKGFVVFSVSGPDLETAPEHIFRTCVNNADSLHEIAHGQRSPES